MPVKIRPLAKKLMNNPVEINIAISKPAAGVDQKAYVVFDDQKNNLIVNLLAERKISTALIFASTKIAVKTLEKELQRRNLPAAAIRRAGCARRPHHRRRAFRHDLLRPDA